MNQFVNDAEVRRSFSILVSPGKLSEVRILRKRPKNVYSGIFRTADDLLKALHKMDLLNTNIYIVLNAINESCAAMEQYGQFLAGVETIKDGDIDYYVWFVIDIDAIRKSGISSNNEELKGSFSVATTVYNFLRENSWPEPVKAISGNGAHLLYKIALANNDENKKLLQDCLKVLDQFFSNEHAEIDTTLATPAHTIKLYGTLAQKGRNTEDRPHRMSRIVYVPETIQPVDKVKLEWLAAQMPKTEEPNRNHQQQQHSHNQIDVEDFLRKHGAGYKPLPIRGGTKFVLDVCPFNSEHKAPDACVFQYADGSLGFKCFHNSDRDKTIKDFFLYYDPEFYTKTERSDWQIETSWTRCTNANRETVKLNIAKPAADEPVFLTAQDIISRHEPEAEYLQTGIPGIDYNMKGLAKGSVSCLSGLRASAKSTLLSQLMLMMINNNQTVVAYSGELSAKNFMKWMFLQAAGKRHTVPSQRYRNFYTLDNDETEKEIASWMQGHFYLFNNAYGNKFAKLAMMLKDQAETVHADCIVLDNLMAVDLGNNVDKYDAQTNFVWALKNIAKITNTHVIFVAHPRKTTGFLRLNDISGSGNIGNIVDAAFIIHRNNEDFSKATAEFFGKKKSHYIPEDCTNVLEICKDRENGTQDFFIPLWYEPETKRLLPSTDQNLHFGWETMFKQQIPLMPEQDVFYGYEDGEECTVL